MKAAEVEEAAALLRELRDTRRLAEALRQRWARAVVEVQGVQGWPKAPLPAEAVLHVAVETAEALRSRLQAMGVDMEGEG